MIHSLRTAFAGLATFVACVALGACKQVSDPSSSTLAPSTSAHASQSTSPAAGSKAGAPREQTVVASPWATEAVNAPDRSADDRALDEGRHPIEMLSFFGVTPGQRVAEIAAGGGYTAELLARVVHPEGKVYGVNSKWILERFAEKPWSERLKKPVMANVVRIDRDFDDPLPPEAKDLDAVFMVLFYHDTVWQKVDRAKMNKAIFNSLKSRGVYAIVDHSGRAGTGTSETETLHRIEESVVKAEIEAAGFRLEKRGSFLENPNDTRDWNGSPRAAAERRGTTDRFVLKFVKP
ncbi:MAG: SAM-dependent methyltransferase [Polyangiaceae bacterium]